MCASGSNCWSTRLYTNTKYFDFSVFVFFLFFFFHLLESGHRMDFPPRKVSPAVFVWRAYSRTHVNLNVSFRRPGTNHPVASVPLTSSSEPFFFVQARHHCSDSAICEQPHHSKASSSSTSPGIRCTDRVQRSESWTRCGTPFPLHEAYPPIVSGSAADSDPTAGPQRWECAAWHGDHFDSHLWSSESLTK